MSFNQGIPGPATLINSSSTLLYGNSASANALSVQQLGAGNVASFRTTTGATALFVGANGNVGVGTTSPCKFNVDNGTGTGLNTFIQASGITAGGTTGFLLGKALSTNNCATMNWNHVGDGLGTNYLGIGAYANDSKLNITAAGNVGIGTTSPGYILEVSNSTSSTSTSFLGLTNPYVFGFNTGLNIGSSIVYSSRWQGDGGSGVVEMCKIDGRKEQNANFGDSYLAFQTRYVTDRGLGGAGTLTEKMRISGNGNVGIGITNPGSLLEISGTGAVHASGTLSFYRSDAATFWKFQGPDTGNTLYLKPTNSAYGVYITATSTAWASASDARLKNIIEPISDAVAKVNRLNPVIYSWKADETNQPHPGLIAQDVLEVQPEVVATDGNGMYGVQYTELVPLAFAAIQELSAENTALKQSLVTATARLDSLEARLAAAGL